MDTPKTGLQRMTKIGSTAVEHTYNELIELVKNFLFSVYPRSSLLFLPRVRMTDAAHHEVQQAQPVDGRPGRPSSLSEKGRESRRSGGSDVLAGGLAKETLGSPDAHDPSGKRELKEHECYDKLGYCWPRWKKWTYLAAVAFVQVSMNFNTSVFPNAVSPIAEHFGISEQKSRVGQMIYLVTYSFGCELWAPWSEEFGRWPILQLSMFLINIWQLPAALAPNWGSIVVARALVCSHTPCSGPHRSDELQGMFNELTHHIIGWPFYCRW